MAYVEYRPGSGMHHTNHSVEIEELRRRALMADLSELESAACVAAADLLVCHDDTGISLDDWHGPARLMRLALRGDFLKNHV